jgi:hypothetical protein
MATLKFSLSQRQAAVDHPTRSRWRTPLFIYALTLAYGGGLWLHLLHEWAGAHERIEIPPVLHWLRDSSLALPAVLVAVGLGMLVWRRLSQRLSPGLSRLALVVILGLSATLAFTAGVPVHAALFGAEHAHHESTAVASDGHSHANEEITAASGPAEILSHALSDGLQALPVNLVIAAFITLLLGKKPLDPGKPKRRFLARFIDMRRWNAWLDQPVVVVQPKSARRRRASRLKWTRRLARSLVSTGTLFAILLGPLQGVAVVRASPALVAPACRVISADVVALDQTIVYNRLGVIDPEGMIFALRQDVVDKTSGLSEAAGGILTSGNVQLRSDKRPRPLTLRMNVGDCLTINFQNLFNPTPIGGAPATRNAGISVLGMQLKNSILSDGSNVGQNATTTGTAMAGLVAPGGTATYTFYAEHEGGYELYSPTDNVSAEGIGVLAHGLFGAVNVEPTGAEWYRSQVTRVEMDWATPPETFTDLNLNGVWDAAVPADTFTDTNNNGVLDAAVPADTYTDVNLNGVWDAAVLAEPLLTDTNGNGGWDAAVPADTYTDVNSNGVWDSGEPLLTDANGNGVWDAAVPADTFTDTNNNGVWAAAIPAEPLLTDTNNNGVWDAAVPAETFTDTNGNGVRDAAIPAETFTDTNGDGIWNAHLTTPDGHPVINYDAVYPAGHRFAGKPILKMLDASKIVYSDLTAVITGPGRGNFGQGGSPAYPVNPTYPNRNQPFREFTIVFHDEAAVLQAFQVFNNPDFLFTLHGVRDGKAINYGTGGIAAEVLANRFGVGPSANCPECKLEEFFLTSWALGDPAQIVDVPANTGCGADCTGAQGPKATQAFYPDDPSNVYHTYINDHTKFRNIHVGKEHHIFHLHSHQWLETPDDDNSSYLDSQAIGPGASYTYEIAYNGSGNRNKTPGDAIFHCHFYPHFAQGMWALWRSHDVFQRGTQLDANGRPISGGLPDGEIATGTPTPALVPIPGQPMAPMPGVESQIVNGQIDLDGNGIADYTEGWPAPAGNPGYPFYIPGVAGHRPPTPALDMTEPQDIGLATSQRRVYDGGLPRHVITGGTALSTITPLDLSKVLHAVTAVYPPEAGTPAEVQAMAFHAQLRHDTYKPDGTPAIGSSGYETNGLPPTPGAPYAEPCRNDNGTFNSTAPLRVYKAADIQLDMKINKLGWHFPQARMLALWQDVGPMLSGQAAPQPFVMRTNSGDCLNYYHTNLIPGNYEQDAYQVRTPTDIIGQHIHLVKFDVTSSDGSGNGFNYEDGTLSPDEVRERIDAIRAQNGCTAGAGAPGNPTCPVAAAHPFFGPGPNGKWLGARTTIQRWWADPVLNNAGQDRTLGNVYTHDHYGPSTHQQTGLYATLIIEPTKSAWRDPETGNCYGNTSIVGRSVSTDPKNGGCKPVARIDGGPTSWRADVITADNAGVITANYDKDSFREFYFEFSDFQHAYVTGKGATFANTTVTIGGKSYTVPVATIAPDALYAINPAGAIQNTQVQVSPWLKVKPTLEGTANVCPTNTAMSFSATGCPETISTADIGTFSMNYRNEPVAARVLDPATMKQAAGDAGDLSLAFSSNIVRKDTRLNVQPTFYPPLTQDVKPGDPYTPMMRVYEADKVRIKVQVGATEEGHNASLWANKWLQEYASPNSGWRSSQMMGISEQFNWDTSTAVDPAQKGVGADYLFSPDNSVDGMWNGMWSLLHSYSKFRVKKNDTLGTDLLPLPNNRLDLKTNQVNAVSNTNEFDSKTKYLCPTAAPKVTFNVTAVLARDALPNGTLVYNSRTANGGPLHDPTAILYVRSSDLDASGKLKPGVPVEPLILRARAGDCINLQLKNNLPATATGPLPDLNGYNTLPPIIDRYTVSSSAAPGTFRDTFNANDVRPSNRVGLRPQLVTYDTTRGAGNSVGGNGNNTVAPGAIGAYWWYAGDLAYNVATGKMTATPIEFGAINLVSSDPIKHSNKGAIGGLIIEPQGSTWIEDANSRASATVTYSGGTFRDFVLLFQDDINMRFGVNGTVADGGAVPFVAGADDAEDTGMKGLNYRTEPQWYRLGIDPAAAEGVAQTFDFTNVLANSQVGGDPQTPIFTATAGDAIRLRVLQPNGHGRNHVFALHGHVWQRNPYTSSCTGTPCLGSTQIGYNPLSEWRGAQEGHGPTDHWDIVPAHGAGGAFGVAGDYLYRDMASISFYDGVWGILRVR